jgi:CO dehydrogenase maturation factor
MKISVCGKGGSGKSTIVALLANEAQVRGYRVLVVDSD